MFLRSHRVAKNLMHIDISKIKCIFCTAFTVLITWIKKVQSKSSWDSGDRRPWDHETQLNFQTLCLAMEHKESQICFGGVVILAGRPLLCIHSPPYRRISKKKVPLLFAALLRRFHSYRASVCFSPFSCFASHNGGLNSTGREHWQSGGQGWSWERETKTVRNALIMTSPTFPTADSILMGALPSIHRPRVGFPRAWRGQHSLHLNGLFVGEQKELFLGL